MSIRRSVVTFAAAATLLGLPAAAHTVGATAHTANSPNVVMGVPTLVDPIRASGEPQIDVDRDGNPYVAVPGGSLNPDTGFYWHSFDGGQTYRLLGGPNGHPLCPDQTSPVGAGGGDVWTANDAVSNEQYFLELQAFDAHMNTGYSTNGGRTITSQCAADATHTGDDRPFAAVIDPSPGSPQVAPQYVQAGNKPVVYASLGCVGCSPSANNPNPYDSLDYLWSTDGLHWTTADVGVANPALSVSRLNRGIATDGVPGNTIVDQTNGYLYTPVVCAGGCPGQSGSTAPTVAVVVNRPSQSAAERPDPTNIGQFASQTTVTVTPPLPATLANWPVITRDRAGTLYVVYVAGVYGNLGNQNGTPPPSPTVPDSRLFHVYVTHSSAGPDYPAGTWSTPQQVDQGPGSLTAISPWAVAGDAGRLAVVWYGQARRELPDYPDPDAKWYPYLAVTADAAAPTPTFRQQSLSPTPTHVGPMCGGGCPYTPLVPQTGDNLLDFFNLDVGPDGALQAVWCDDANGLHALPTSPAGLPLVETSHQVSGMSMFGDAPIHDPGFSEQSRPDGVDAPTGDALYPALTGANVAQLDLTHSSVALDGDHLGIRMTAASLQSTTSPDPARPHVWWLTTWKQGSRLFFAKAESDGGGPPTFTAGAPATFDYIHPNRYQSTPMLADYRGGAPVSGHLDGSQIVIDVPTSLVGTPGPGDHLDSISSWTALDNGLPPFLAPGVGNAPQVVDATPAYNYILGP